MTDSDDDFELYDTQFYRQEPRRNSALDVYYDYDDSVGKLYEYLVGRDQLRTEDEFSDEAVDDSFDEEIYFGHPVSKRDYAIKEIVDTEKRYVGQLSAIIEQFLKAVFHPKHNDPLVMGHK